MPRTRAPADTGAYQAPTGILDSVSAATTGFRLASTVSFVSRHPLFDRLLRSEPEVLLPLLTVDGGPAFELYRFLIAELLRAEIRAGRAATRP
jgi:hypothetical protein